MECFRKSVSFLSFRNNHQSVLKQGTCSSIDPWRYSGPHSLRLHCGCNLQTLVLNLLEMRDSIFITKKCGASKPLERALHTNSPRHHLEEGDNGQLACVNACIKWEEGAFKNKKQKTASVLS